MIVTSYEQFCSAQRPALLTLCDRLGLPPSPQFENGELPKIRASFGGWRRGLDPAVLASIRAQDPARGP